MNLKPLHDWAVIAPSQSQEKTAGGLYIPDTAKEKPAEGVVEAVGPGAYEEKKFGKKKPEEKERKFIPTTVKPGDRVIYERYAGQTYKIGAEERILVREKNILGILLSSPAQGKVSREQERKVEPPGVEVEGKTEAKASRKPSGKPTAKKKKPVGKKPKKK